MRKFYLVIAFAFVALIAINALFFSSLYKMQVNQHKNLLFKQSQTCVSQIEYTISRFESDLNYILFSDDIAKLFKEEDSDGLRKLQLFYSTYNSLIKNIDIYDNNKNVLNLFRDRKQNFITDRYLAQRQRKLKKIEEVNTEKKDYQYILPVFRNNALFANILVTININDYILSELKKFHLEDLTWQWVIDVNTQSVYSTQGISYDWNGELDGVIKNLNNDFEGLLIHTISNDSIDKKLLTVYAPIKVLNKDFGVGLSVDHSTFLVDIYKKLVLVSSLFIFIFALVSIFLLREIKALKKKIEA